MSRDKLPPKNSQLAWPQWAAQAWRRSPQYEWPAGAQAVYRNLLEAQWIFHDLLLPVDEDKLAQLSGDPGAFYEHRVLIFDHLSFFRGGLICEHEISPHGSPEDAPREPPSSAEKRRIRLARAREKGTHTKEQWEELRDAFGRCLRCGDTESALQKDHIIPLYQGGSDCVTNIQPLCKSCNCSKGPDRTDHRVGQPETQLRWLP